MNSDNYYLYKNGQQQGPYTHSQLQSMWRSGTITSNDQYWQEGFDEWQSISLIQEILDEPALRPAAPRYSPPAQLASSSTEKPDTLGVIILLIPAIVTAVMLFGIFGMLPLSTTVFGFLVIGTILLTAILIAIEASQLGMGSRINGKATTGPIAWFFGSLLLWVIVYPAYLFSRSRYGVRNYLLGGIFVALAFTATPLLLSGAGGALGISGSTSLDTPELKRQVESSIRATWSKKPELASARIRNFTLLHRGGNQYDGLIEATIAGEDVQLAVDVTYDGKGFMWKIKP